MMTVAYYAVYFFGNSPTVDVQGIYRISEVSALNSILNWVYVLAGIAAVISIIVGAFWYVTGGDNPSQVQKGKNAIIYASIGLVVVIFAFAITGFVSGRLDFSR